MIGRFGGRGGGRSGGWGWPDGATRVEQNGVERWPRAAGQAGQSGAGGARGGRASSPETEKLDRISEDYVTMITGNRPRHRTGKGVPAMGPSAAGLEEAGDKADRTSAGWRNQERCIEVQPDHRRGAAGVLRAVAKRPVGRNSSGSSGTAALSRKHKTTQRPGAPVRPETTGRIFDFLSENPITNSLGRYQ